MNYKKSNVSMSSIHNAIQRARAVKEVDMTPDMAPATIHHRQIIDQLKTSTSKLQDEVETSVVEVYENATEGDYILKRSKHRRFLRAMVGHLPQQFRTLDASRPWLIYWGLNALSLLEEDISDLQERSAESILALQSPTGGFGGGHGQLSHLAPTYAAVTALAFCQDENAWKRVDRQKMYNWLMRMKQSNGSFTMHEGGEVDTRSSYCALAVASLLNIITDELIQNSADFIKSCQTFEGGFSAIPGTEAHGGYAFCALGALCLIGPPYKTIHKLDVPLLVKWLSGRQSQPEGGFSGRTNKLVDGCYNHWVGGCWALLEAALPHTALWDRQSLQNYTLLCCQDENGGLRDKPGKRPDSYHTNYTLVGLSGAQYCYQYQVRSNDELGDYGFRWTSSVYDGLQVPKTSRVVPINPVHVLPEGLAEKMNAFFKSQDGFSRNF